MNLDQEAIGRIERGERMKFDNLESFAEALGVRVVDLFDPDRAPTPGILSPEVRRICLFISSRAKQDPTFPLRVLKILREI